MFKNNSIDSFVSFLKCESKDTSFLSIDFVATRLPSLETLKTKEDTIEYFLSLIDLISNVSLEYEDSHYLIYYTYKSIEYIVKAKVDDSSMINSFVIEEYNKTLNQVVLTLEYDGKNYYGMQKQESPDKRTIQSEIELALKRMLRKDVDITISSRTDRGVHAKGQTVNFNSFGIEPLRYKIALNDLLPKDIRVKDAYSRSQLFNSRYDVVKKEYQYIINTGEYSVFDNDYCLYQKINDINLLEDELKSLIGTHDFVAFCKGENDNTIRTIYEASLIKENDYVILKFVGNGFLHNMIRFIVGMLIENDKTKSEHLKDIIDSKDKNRTFKIAPASGLYLIKIDY